MNSELKQAAQQALKALNNAVPEDTKQAREQFDAIQALRTALQQATQPAEMTDEQIESCALEAGFSVESTGSIWAVDGYVGTRVDPGLRKFAKAILALRPVRVPMTEEQIRSMCKQGWVFETVKQWVRIIEAHHGITAQGAQEGV